MKKTPLATAIITAMSASSALYGINAQAQTDTEAFAAIEEIVVTARRKDENLQDVPLTVNAVTGDDLADLNIRNMEDVQSIVPGLTLQDDPIAPNASIRGVRFDTFASGFNPTVEFYLNDVSAVSTLIMQALFDVGQIEVLRGPQGTLRGRASPSGSITVTTKRPDLQEIGGFIDVTATDQSGSSIKGAFNLPIIEDVLAVRLAGFVEENESNQVKSTTSGGESEYEGSGWRFTALFEPTDDLSFNLYHQSINPERTTFPQVESGSLTNDDITSTDTIIKADDRLSVSNDANIAEQEIDRTGLEAQWSFADWDLKYAGAITEQTIDRYAVQDAGGVFDESFPEDLQNFHQDLTNEVDVESHELRIQTAAPLFNESIDLVAGVMRQETDSVNHVTTFTPVFFGATAIPATFLTIAETPVVSSGLSTEESVFANLTYYLGENTEISAGARYIQFDTQSQINVAGNIISDIDNDWSDTIYSVSLKHQFNDDLMAYTSYGTSWRPGINVVGNFSVAQTELERSFQSLDPETSESLEFGVKSEWLDNRLRVNVTLYRQEFDNYPYRAGGAGVFYVNTSANTATDPISFVENVNTFNYVAAVPVNVNGIEIENYYRINEQWDVGLMLSYSKGEIDGGVIPCNDYLPADGVPDSGSVRPTVDDIRTATDGDNVASCISNDRSNYAPLFTANLLSQYDFTIGELDAYVRAMANYYGSSKNDPSNKLDDVDPYSLVNLYAGIKNEEQGWSVMLYGKNIFDTVEVTSREANVASVSFTGLDPVTFQSFGSSASSNWREITVTQGRELGVNVKYQF